MIDSPVVDGVLIPVDREVGRAPLKSGNPESLLLFPHAYSITNNVCCRPVSMDCQHHFVHSVAQSKQLKMWLQCEHAGWQ